MGINERGEQMNLAEKIREKKENIAVIGLIP